MAGSVRRISAVGAKIAGFGESGSVCRAFHPTPPGPDSSFGIRAGPLLRGQTTAGCNVQDIGAFGNDSYRQSIV